MHIRNMALGGLVGLALTAIVATHDAYAGPTNYKCAIRSLYSLTPDGTLKHNEFADAKSLVGEFTVDRLIGAVVGDWLPNATASSIRVVHPGNTEMAFRVISHYAERGTVEMLEIHEYVEGPIKPFVALSFAGVAVGVCR